MGRKGGYRGGGRNAGAGRNSRAGRMDEQCNRQMGFFYALLKNKDAEVRSFNDAKRFIDAIDSFAGKAEMLTKLDDARYYGAIRIHDVLSFIEDGEGVEALLIPLLQSVLNKETSRPLTARLRNRVLMSIYVTPALLATLVEFDTAASLTTTSADILCCFLLEISLTFVEPRGSESVKALALALRKRGGVATVDRLCFVLYVDKGPKEIAYAAAQFRADPVAWGKDFNPPGDRHDNDFLNYRDIRLVPTLDEMQSEIPSYLPMASEANKVIDDPDLRLLDSNFRLLREDALQTMKLNISGQVRAWKFARIVDLHSKGNAFNAKAICSLAFKIQFSSETNKNIDWRKSSALSHGSVVALCRDGRPVRLGTISMRDERTEGAWLNAPGGPIIGVIFESDADFVASFLEMDVNAVRNNELCVFLKRQRMKDGKQARICREIDRLLSEMKTYDLIEISRSFCTSQPILRSLQLMDRVPLSDELVHYRGLPLDYIPEDFNLPNDVHLKGYPCNLKTWDSVALAKSTSLDISQADALHHAFSSRIALIQGPPGTGKTFIGGVIARIIRETTNESILCVCYTNHALDQFLEHMLDAGEQRIVRIGGRSRSPQVAPYQLRELSRQQPQGRYHMSALRRVDAQLYQMQEEIEEQILLLKQPVTWEFPLGGIKGLLDVEYPHVSQYLRIPDLMDGFDLVGRGNRKVTKDYLFETWKGGDNVPEWLDPCMPEVNSSGFLMFWTMDHVDRLSLLEVWRAQILQPEVNELTTVSNRFNDLMAEKQMIRRAIDGDILTQARVIGVTTTGAAQYREMLNEKAAGVVVVEEAGEVLEAHVLSSLSVATKHLILIGDHKQLRPKTETYNLTTSANKGYNLDRSLFERLVVSQLPATSLTIQRRMRPEISDFVRSQTYPDLVDHESVLRRPNVRGVKLSVAFIDHDVPEDGHSQVDQALKTKSNRYEAEFCVEIVRYLLLQGYRPSDIVVLTPYVGQLMHIASFVKQNLKEVTAYVSESDAIELDDLGVEGMGQGNDGRDDATSNNVRCSSIDNFQGEEADIIIVSLVRSNASGMIGFLKEPQRVNVLLSRARSGMFLVGNQKTLTLKSGKAVWGPLFDLMHQRGQIQEGFPSVCQLHPEDDDVVLRSVEDFRKHRPNGGCDRPCMFRLPCGHACQKSCHPIDQGHVRAQRECSQACRRFPPECTLLHVCEKMCCQECGPCAALVQSVALPCGRILDVARCHDVRNVEALNKCSTSCKAPTQHIFLRCGHVCRTSCSNSRQEVPRCPSLCDALLTCGHKCKNKCGMCAAGHSCKASCARSLFCSHLCGRACHDGKECEPCKEKCQRACNHSVCPRQCCDPCSSCVEPCDWICEHKGQCPLVCGAPCSRLPCNERCSKFLSCGHRCPSLCGEDCPLAEFCQICGTKQSGTPDMVLLQSYEEIDLFDDPVIVLRCGHFYTVSTLDGLFEMKSVFESNQLGQLIGLRSVHDSSRSEKHILCPQCRMPIQNVYRYGRILKFSELRALERKHMMAMNQLMRIVTASGTQPLIAILEKLEMQIMRSPMKVIWEASAGHSDTFVPNPPPSQRIRILELLADAHQSKIEKVEDDFYNKSVSYYQEGIQLATESSSIKSNARLRLALEFLVSKWRSPSPALNMEIKGLLEWILQQEHIPDLKKVASQRLHQLLNGGKIIAEVVAAMNVLDIDEYDYGGGWASHWFQCSNGHPFFIGQCGGAMEVSRCFECGQAIGGQSHVLLASNQHVTGDVAVALRHV